MGVIEKALGDTLAALLAGYNPLIVLAIIGLMGGLFFMTQKVFSLLDRIDKIRDTAAAEIADLNKQLNNEIRSATAREDEMSRRYDASVELLREMFESKRGRS